MFKSKTALEQQAEKLSAKQEELNIKSTGENKWNVNIYLDLPSINIQEPEMNIYWQFRLPMLIRHNIIKHGSRNVLQVKYLLNIAISRHSSMEQKFR